MDCEYCDFSEWRGKEFTLCKNIDGSHQEFEMGLFDNPEQESAVLFVMGGFTDVEIEINYCPICGKKI